MRAETKIHNFNVHGVGEQDIFRLEVAMHDVLAVHILHGREKLRVEFGCHPIGKPTLTQQLLLVLLDVVEELTLFDVLHDEVYFAGRLHNLVDADDVGMPQLLQNVDFLDDSAQFAGAFHALLLEYFDCHLPSHSLYVLVGEDVLAELDFTEGALTDGVSSAAIASVPI